MSDFETHPRGTNAELKLSRELASAIENELQNDPESIPILVRQAYNRLYGQYIRQIQMEDL